MENALHANYYGILKRPNCAGFFNQNFMAEKQIQEYLFQRIKESIPNNRTLVDVVAEALYISQDSAYRRIRGETLLVLEEAQVLCRRFNISLDQLLNLSTSSVVFQNIEVDNVVIDFKTYLQGILQRIKHLNSFEKKTIIYLTKDIPIFHQFCFKPVISFRYFFWMKTMFQHPEFSKRKFTPDCLPQEIEDISTEILLQYGKLPSVEIWNTESINSILVQINYSVETGMMNKQDALAVYDGLRRTLVHLQMQAEYGRKFLPGENVQSKKDNFQFFYNRVGLGDTTILTLHEGIKTVHLNYDVLNYVFTTDESFCNQVHKKLQTIMRSSTLISGGSEKQRNQFFNILYAKLPLTQLKSKTDI